MFVHNFPLSQRWHFILRLDELVKSSVSSPLYEHNTEIHTYKQHNTRMLSDTKFSVLLPSEGSLCWLLIVQCSIRWTTTQLESRVSRVRMRYIWVVVSLRRICLSRSLSSMGYLWAGSVWVESKESRCKSLSKESAREKCPSVCLSLK